MPHPSPDDIYAAYQVAAEIVEKFGETYLPVFLRLEDEIEALQGRNSAMERARRVVQRKSA